jgi:hypothetical protein
MLWVIAYNMPQADYWMRQWGIPRSNWHYLAVPEGVRGVRGGDVVYVGTPWERNDIPDIERAVKCCGFDLVTERVARERYGRDGCQASSTTTPSAGGVGNPSSEP